MVKEFQAHYKLPEDGIVTETILDKIKKILNPPYQDGDRAVAITKLKKDLSSLGYGNFPSNPSLNYGKVTVNVVKEFQEDNNLTVDGIAGTETLNKITELLKSQLSIGSNSSEVKKLKKDLTALGFGNFPKDPSKTYGNVTARVVKEFQGYYKLAKTGTADEATLNKIAKVLNPPYVNGDRGVAITQLKKDLSSLGYGSFPGNPSLKYGNVTANVVKEFQKDNGLAADGKADKATLGKVNELLKLQLSMGSKGPEVKQLKIKLRALGVGNFPSNPSETYGNVTTNVVKQFQEHYKLPVTGVVNQATREKITEILNPPYRIGDRGVIVVQLKKDLTALGYGNFPDNPSFAYGQVTADAVNDFQKAFGLKANGIANEKTLNKISELVSSRYAPGQTGDHVKKMKEDLTDLGFGNFPSNPSQTYGNVTANVVKEFQAYAKLPITGIADEATLSKIEKILNPPYKDGDRGIAIVKIKQNLSDLGFGNFPKNPSINYGTVTANVVKEFQEVKGLEVTGIVNEETLIELATRITEKIEVEEIDFETIYEDDATLEIGTEKVSQKGEKGKTEIVYQITTVYGEETERTEVDRIETEPVDEIILRGTQEPVFEEVTDEESIPFDIEYEEDPELTVGVEEVIQEGKNGMVEVTYEVKYLNNKEVSRTEKNRETVTEPVTKVIKIGTKVATEEEQFEYRVFELVNEERGKEELSPLKYSSVAASIAREHSEHMAEHGDLYHSTETDKVYSEELKKRGVSWNWAAENVANGYPTPEAVVEGWMESEGHRKNILSEKGEYIGVGYSPDGHFWTQVFYKAK